MARRVLGRGREELRNPEARHLTAADPCAHCSTAAPRPSGNPREYHAIAVDARGPQFDGGIVTRLDTVPFAVVFTSWPARVSCWAAASPAGPEPTTATRFPVRPDGGAGTTSPSLNARSTMEISICLIVTGSVFSARTQAGSHGAGQIQPVNSGKLFVACNR